MLGHPGGMTESLSEGIDIYQCSYVNKDSDLFTIKLHIAADDARFAKIKPDGGAADDLVDITELSRKYPKKAVQDYEKAIEAAGKFFLPENTLVFTAKGFGKGEGSATFSMVFMAGSKPPDSTKK